MAHRAPNEIIPEIYLQGSVIHVLIMYTVVPTLFALCGNLAAYTNSVLSSLLSLPIPRWSFG